MRPVPVVFLRLAFSPQLTIITCQLRYSVSMDGLQYQRTLAGLSSGVSTRGASVLLDVKGAATCVKIRQQRALMDDFRDAQSNVYRKMFHVPQRRQSVCVLLWRLPKLEVPFAVSRSVLQSRAFAGRSVSRTHLVGRSED